MVWRLVKNCIFKALLAEFTFFSGLKSQVCSPEKVMPVVVLLLVFKIVFPVISGTVLDVRKF